MKNADPDRGSIRIKKYEFDRLWDVEQFSIKKSTLIWTDAKNEDAKMQMDGRTLEKRSLIHYAH